MKRKNMAKINFTNKVAVNENSSIPDVNKCKASDINEIKEVVNQNDDNVGNPANLNTTAKNVVGAINEVKEEVSKSFLSIKMTKDQSFSNNNEIAFDATIISSNDKFALSSNRIKVNQTVRAVNIMATIWIEAPSGYSLLYLNRKRGANTEIVASSMAPLNASQQWHTQNINIITDAQKDDLFYFTIGFNASNAGNKVPAGSYLNSNVCTAGIIEL